MKKALRKTIVTNSNGYLFLMRKGRMQRGFDLSDGFENCIKENFAKFAVKGKIEILDRNLGGGCGSQNPSTWTSWTVEDMAKMLEDENIPFEIGECEVWSF